MVPSSQRVETPALLLSKTKATALAGARRGEEEEEEGRGVFLVPGEGRHGKR